MPGIVVGVDGSTGSHKALEWAAREAGAHHGPLTVLAVNPIAISQWTGNPISYPEADQPEEQEARQAAQVAAAKVTSELGADQPASVSVRAVSGSVAQELLNASHDADLLVVGSRGGGGFASLRMGSVSTQVVGHASCPVVVVPS